jgi:hypothetical protein
MSWFKGFARGFNCEGLANFRIDHPWDNWVHSRQLDFLSTMLGCDADGGVGVSKNASLGTGWPV